MSEDVVVDGRVLFVGSALDVNSNELAMGHIDGLRETISYLERADIERAYVATQCHLGSEAIRLLKIINHRWPTLRVYFIIDAGSLESSAFKSLGLSSSVHAPDGEVRSNSDSTFADRARSPTDGPVMVGVSASMKAVLSWAARVARTDAPVLVTGETGTGKDMIAQSIHSMSPRRKGPFVAIDCGAIPEGFLQAELFGYKKGAFTSAAMDKPGLVEQAHQGTLFLDEIGELPSAMQSSLLRFLESGEFRRLGDNRLRRVDVRLIAATNRNLRADASKGRFRQDLYYRLDVARVELPPLRNRRDDIAPLVGHWCRNRPPMSYASVSPAALSRLLRYSWPGNVRELRNVLERAAILSAGGQIDQPDIDQALQSGESCTDSRVEGAENDEGRRGILRALDDNHWHLGRTAASLAMSRWTLRRLLVKLKLQK